MTELLLVTLLGALLFALPASAHPLILALGIATGMPHGATDILTDRGGLSRPALGYYAVSILLLSALWFWSPSWALATFLTLSMLHFGSEDAATESGTALFLHETLVRGMLVVLAPSIFHEAEVLRLFGLLAETSWAGHDWTQVLSFARSLWIFLAFTLFGHYAVRSTQWRHVVFVFAQILVLVAVFRLLQPLTAFVAYFVGGHSLHSARKIWPVLKEHRTKVLGATAFTFIVAAGVFWASGESALDDRLIRTAFISLSLFAVPHGIWRTAEVLRDRWVRA
ncbi:MAG: Brp/Blh family beta-carotene 15,15'-dioxygenase [Bacteroidota bacterium]